MAHSVQSASDQLWNGVRELGTEYGIERSVRLCHGAVLGDRYLLSLHLPAAGASRRNELVSLIHKLNPPDLLWLFASRLLDQSAYVHFGYEHTGSAHVYKAYAELPAPPQPIAGMVSPQAPSRAKPHVRFWAVKWDAECAARYVISRYTHRPSGSLLEIHDLMGRIVHASQRAVPSYRFMMNLIGRFAGLPSIADPDLLEVTERGNARRSFDLNVSPLGLRVQEIAADLTQLLTDYAIPGPHQDRVLAALGPLPLGHIAAGTHRGGEDFVSLYYGAKAGHV